jgi:hypothetical protein
MDNSNGYTEWIEENIEELAEEYYGEKVDKPEDKFYSDLNFKNFCTYAWDDACEAYQLKQEPWMN